MGSAASASVGSAASASAATLAAVSDSAASSRADSAVRLVGALRPANRLPRARSASPTTDCTGAPVVERVEESRTSIGRSATPISSPWEWKTTTDSMTFFSSRTFPGQG